MRMWLHYGFIGLLTGILSLCTALVLQKLTGSDQILLHMAIAWLIGGPLGTGVTGWLFTRLPVPLEARNGCLFIGFCWGAVFVLLIFCYLNFFSKISLYNESMMVRLEDSIVMNFKTDGLGFRRYKEVVGQNVTYFVYDLAASDTPGLAPLVAEYDENGNLVAKYHHDGDLIAMTKDERLYFIGCE